MDLQDHAYTESSQDKYNQVEFTYKMNSKEVQDFVKLKASNSGLFSGKRNSAMWAWRTILKHMNLHHKMTHYQASKKWENLKKKHRDLKYPPDGVIVFPEAWPFFKLMDDALEGRLEGSAPILEVISGDSMDFLPSCKFKKRKISMAIDSPAAFFTGGSDVEVSLDGDEDGEEKALQEEDQGIDCLEVVQKRNLTERKGQLTKREKQVTEREHQVLQREKAVLDREIAALDRERASLERERTMIEKERALMERERVMMKKDREALNRDWLVLEQERQAAKTCCTCRKD